MRVAVIGIGVMGRNHARIYSELEGTELAAVADTDRKRGAEISDKYGCRCYTDYRKMLKAERPDAVSLCVPTSLHHRVARDVIGNGAHLLIEKPIAKTVKEAEDIVDLAEKAGIKLAVGHIERFNPAVQELKKLIDRGKLGNITSILARRVGIMPPRIKDANVVVDIAVHDIDVFRYLLGRNPERIEASGGKALVKDREDYADIFLKYNGTNGFIEVNWITPVKIRMLNVTGTKGYAQLNYITQDLKMYESVYEKSYDEFGDFVLNFGDPREVHIKVGKEEPLRAELENFMASVKKGTDPLVSGSDGIEALKIIERVMEAIGRG